jgi:malate dehydrogenase
MSFIAIIGAGPTGGAIAHKVAARDRVGEVRLIDDDERIAAGKALDIVQSGPVEGFSTRVIATSGIVSAAGAAAIVLADHAGGQGEHAGEAGLALLRKLSKVEGRAPIVLAGANQLDLVSRAVSELHISASRLLGSAPFALESALRALTGLAVDASGVQISLTVVGVPPHAAVVGWEEATAFGQPLSSHLAAHIIAALSARIPGIWPPGPYALASAASRVVEAIVNGSRRRFSCFVALGGGTAATMPVELGEDGVLRIIEPTLTRQEQTRLDSAISYQTSAIGHQQRKTES